MKEASTIAFFVIFVSLVSCTSNYNYVKKVGKYQTNEYTLINQMVNAPEDTREIIIHYGSLSKEFKRGSYYKYIEKNLINSFDCCYIIYIDRTSFSITGKYHYLYVLNEHRDKVMIVTFFKRMLFKKWVLHSIEFRYFLN